MTTPALPAEESLLAWAQTQLQDVEAGSSYFYDVDAAWRVTRPRAAYLDSSLTTIAMIHPADINIDPSRGSTCATEFDGTFFVTMARRYDQPLNPAQQTEAPTTVQLKLFADVVTALHNQRFNGAPVLVRDRNLDIGEAEGWVITQVLLGTDWSQVDA